MTTTIAPVSVTLSHPELFQAALVGVMRQIQNIRNGRDKRPAHGAPADRSWNMHIEGACGELALAKYLRAYWSGCIGDVRADDVGRYQVRTRSRADYDLIVHPEDADDRPFVLVTGQAPSFRLMGWIMGADAKRDKWWKDPAGGRPAFFVPQSELWEMEALPRP